MQQTALNLIAIGVFLMTLSVFLVPLLNISPFIPAAATLGIMGLATLDTFTFQGRGVTLLLDRFAPTEYRQRVIHHEAGHFLAAYLLGIPIANYSITAWDALKQGQPGLGGVQFDRAAIEEKIQDPLQFSLLIERLCTVWMAGIAAEKLTYGSSFGGEDDTQQLQMALKLAGVPQYSYPQKKNWGLVQAKNLIERNQTAYNALVQAMSQRSTVEECINVIKQV
ncbi:ATP-dependent Zn protease [Aphanothece hegewaldii CCALA 016]|uniref:ATP-dependent Zn protease n=1 Tax=Aphanothece hegewaldii CCALA 016 TaxID=2107694 RepID=A0A2T1LUL1_9CHRO|nr:ATP-dependent Zn protease [Aphanothece hegewaldii]PSF35244.1 ATP-dependent Zn protease [Aphanothece hegewaldii CCALA 016]